MDEYEIRLAGTAEIPEQLDSEQEYVIATRMAVDNIKVKPLGDGSSKFTFICKPTAYVDIEKTDKSILRGKPSKWSQKLRYIVEGEVDYDKFMPYLLSQLDDLITDYKVNTDLNI
jgi:hypothetical protein